MAKSLKRITLATRIVLTIFLESDKPELFGLDIVRKSGYPSGTIYQILERLESSGWLHAFKEDRQKIRTGRPQRRYYSFTPIGKHLAIELLKEYKPSVNYSPANDTNLVSANRYNSNIRCRSREENIQYFNDYHIGTGRSEIELIGEDQAPIRIPFIQESDLDSNNPLQIEKLEINNTEYTSSSLVIPEKIIIDLVEKKKTYISGVIIPQTIIRGARNFELQIGTKVNSSSNYRSDMGFWSETDNYVCQMEFPGAHLRPVDDTFLDQIYVSSTPDLLGDEMLDIKESANASKHLKIKDGVITWKPKKTKLGYSYIINAEKVDQSNSVSV